MLKTILFLAVGIFAVDYLYSKYQKDTSAQNNSTSGSQPTMAS